MRRTPFNEMARLTLDWQRPFELKAVTDMLAHLASHAPQVPLVFEARGCLGQIKYFLGVDRKFKRIITGVMNAHGNIRFTTAQVDARTPVNFSSQLRIDKSALSLKTNVSEAVVRAGLAALLQPKNGEQAVLQVVLGRAFSPFPMPYDLPDPHASWVKIALNGVREASPESRSSIKEKLSCPSFNAVVRLGATGTRETGNGHILSLLSALRILRSAGVSIQVAAENPKKLNLANIPKCFPLRLSVKELVNFLLLPTGENVFPGVDGLHPKQIMPPKWYQNPFPIHDRTFAYSLDKKHKLSISPKDSLEHTHILGPCGSGKSTVM
jgi:hypothetical protein